MGAPLEALVFPGSLCVYGGYACLQQVQLLSETSSPSNFCDAVKVVPLKIMCFRAKYVSIDLARSTTTVVV